MSRYDPERFKLDLAAYQQWRHASEACEMSKSALKRKMGFAIQELLSEKQKLYLLEYFGRRVSMEEVGELYGVNKSTVSRTIHRGLNRIYRWLRYADPRLLDAKGHMSTSKFKKFDEIHGWGEE